MAAAPMKAPLAPSIELVGGYTVRVTALDPTTGATVTGVVVSHVAMQVDTLSDAGEVPDVPDFLPSFVYSKGAA